LKKRKLGEKTSKKQINSSAGRAKILKTPKARESGEVKVWEVDIGKKVRTMRIHGWETLKGDLRKEIKGSGKNREKKSMNFRDKAGNPKVFRKGLIEIGGCIKRRFPRPMPPDSLEEGGDRGHGGCLQS